MTDPRTPDDHQGVTTVSDDPKTVPPGLFAPDVPDTPDRTDAIARVLHQFTDGLNGEGTAGWPERHREVYALAIEEVADALNGKLAAVAALADQWAEHHPQALLDALVRVGQIGSECAERRSWEVTP